MTSGKSWSRRGRQLLRKIVVVISLAALLLLWQAAVLAFHIPSFLLPAPTVILESMATNWPILLRHGAVTLAETLAGFGLSVIVGIPLAVCIVMSQIIEWILYPLLVASQAVPKVALAPLLLVTLGYGAMPKVIIAFLIAFFPVVVNTVTGLTSVNREMLRLLSSMGASRRDIFLKVRFPYAVPAMIAGFKVAIALAVVGAVVGEFVGGRSGLGYYMLVATGNFDTPLIFACIVVLTVMGVALFYAVSIFEVLLARFYRAVTPGRADEPGSWSM